MKWLSLVIALVVALFVVTCGSDEKFGCAASAGEGTCTSAKEKVSFCCSTSKCEYRVGSHVFACNGHDDCTSAAQDLATYCAAS